MSEVVIPGSRRRIKPELKCLLYLVILLDRVVELASAVDHFIVCGGIYLVTHMDLINVIFEHPFDELLLDDALDVLAALVLKNPRGGNFLVRELIV